MSDEVPNEVWHEVFCYLPREALKAVSLTRSTFLAISRPLLFKNFYFQLGIRRLGDWSSSRTSAGNEARALARLAFWSSNDIAPLVHSCTLAYHKGHVNMSLFGAFFERLPRFTNLRSFHGDDIELTQGRLAVLCGLPALRSLHLRGWRAAPGQQIIFSSALLPVAVFHAHRSWQSWTDDSNPNAWLNSLSPDTLRELVVATAPLHTTQHFPHVHTLEMRVSPDLSPPFDPQRHRRSDGWPCQEMLPVLENYNGVQQILYPFLSRSTLTRIVVHDSHPHDLINALRGVSTCINITSLTMTVALHQLPTAAFDTEALKAICMLLPRLTKLSVSVTGNLEAGVPNIQPTHVLNLLGNTPILPRSLQLLIIVWTFLVFNPVPPDQSPDFECIRANVTTCCPVLELFWLDAVYSLSHWRKIHGEVQEFTGYTETEVNMMRIRVGEWLDPVSDR
ncbi:hypothetical protein B0H16DRAFT_1454004 [Mycena metata]|uniref:F-box domain-containing protein n=1 Tax=Mycena metata TaxID=1033252 RepID=A0AAD7JM17_9AGAR|nr:hypothetical protein B0H16DRAFT_1454004 [Mycena metata]